MLSVQRMMAEQFGPALQVLHLHPAASVAQALQAPEPAAPAAAQAQRCSLLPAPYLPSGPCGEHRQPVLGAKLLARGSSCLACAIWAPDSVTASHMLCPMPRAGRLQPWPCLAPRQTHLGSLRGGPGGRAVGPLPHVCRLRGPQGQGRVAVQAPLGRLCTGLAPPATAAAACATLCGHAPAPGASRSSGITAGSHDST